MKRYLKKKEKEWDEKIIALFQARGTEITVIVIIALMLTRFTLFFIG